MPSDIDPTATAAADENSFNGAALILAIISLVIYVLFLRPSTTATNNTATETAAASRTGRTRRQTAAADAGGASRAAAAVAHNAAAARFDGARANTTVQRRVSEAAQEVLETCRSKPVHVNSPVEKTGTGGSNILFDGLVTFRHTQAATSSTATASSLRPERARILARLLTGSSSAPPNKGTTLVVCVSHEALPNPILSRTLYVLGTYYNLVVLIGVPPTTGGAGESFSSLRNKHLERLRVNEALLTEEVLPSHRVLLSANTTGRVAVVRQLAKVSLVVDWEPEVATQLERFGYKVALIPDWNKVV